MLSQGDFHGISRRFFTEKVRYARMAKKAHSIIPQSNPDEKSESAVLRECPWLGAVYGNPTPANPKEPICKRGQSMGKMHIDIQ
jgi:hypothetical protein